MQTRLFYQSHICSSFLVKPQEVLHKHDKSRLEDILLQNNPLESLMSHSKHKQQRVEEKKRYCCERVFGMLANLASKSTESLNFETSKREAVFNEIRYNANAHYIPAGLQRRQLMWIITAHHVFKKKWSEAQASAMSARPSSFFEPIAELREGKFTRMDTSEGDIFD
jgi:hypothetical protein